MRFPSSKEVVARLQAWDEAAYVWVTGLTVGRSSWFCGGYGLGMAAMAIGPGQAPALPWLAIAGCLFLAGLAHDNERGSTLAALPSEPDDLVQDPPAAYEPRRCMPPELADMLYPDNRVALGVQADIASARPVDEEDTLPSASGSAAALPKE